MNQFTKVQNQGKKIIRKKNFQVMIISLMSFTQSFHFRHESFN